MPTSSSPTQSGAPLASSPPLSSTTLVRQLRRLLVARQRLPALELALGEVDRPAEPAFVRRDRGVVLDPADDEAALDPEEIERDHADQLHALRLARGEERVPEVERALAVDPELVPEPAVYPRRVMKTGIPAISTSSRNV